MARHFPRWFRAPGLRDWAGEPERRSTALEDFFDLIFAVAITQLTGRLGDRHALLGFGAFLALFMPTLWIWLGHVVYSNRFDPDDPIHRLFTFGIMLAAMDLTIHFPAALGSGSRDFALAYLAARVCLLALYWRAGRHVLEARGMVRLYLIGFGLGAALWGVSLFVAPPLRFGLWALGLVIDFTVPWLGRPLLQRFPLHASHLMDRAGIFVLLVLGVSLADVVSALMHAQWQPLMGLVAGLAFCLAVCIWWMYFTFVKLAPIECGLGSGQPYIYSHIPMLIGLPPASVGLENLILLTRSDRLPLNVIELLGSGLVLWLIGFLTLQVVSRRAALHRHVVPVYLGAAIATGAWLVPPFRPLVVMLGIVFIFACVVLVELLHASRSEQHRAAEAARPPDE